MSVYFFGGEQRLARSEGLDDDLADEISVETTFSHAEVAKLYHIFHKIDADGSGNITLQELLSLQQFLHVL